MANRGSRKEWETWEENGQIKRVGKEKGERRVCEIEGRTFITPGSLF